MKTLLTAKDIKLTRERFRKKLYWLRSKEKITEEQEKQAQEWYDKHQPKPQSLRERYPDAYAHFKKNYSNIKVMEGGTIERIQSRET